MKPEEFPSVSVSIGSPVLVFFSLRLVTRKSPCTRSPSVRSGMWSIGIGPIFGCGLLQSRPNIRTNEKSPVMPKHHRAFQRIYLSSSCGLPLFSEGEKIPLRGSLADHRQRLHKLSVIAEAAPLCGRVAKREPRHSVADELVYLR